MTSEFPAHLYKYRSMADAAQADYVRDILLNDRLYWPSPVQFNDPFDCAPVAALPESRAARAKYARALTKRAASNLPKHERKSILRGMLRDNLAMMEATVPQIVRERLSKIGVCSFSEVPDDILMWSHYADAHRGICLQFTPSRFDFSLYVTFPVQYSTVRPVLNVAEEDMNVWGERAVLTKADHWSYEREWRTMDVEGPGFHSFRSGVLDAVILGASIRDAQRQLLLEWVSKRSAPTRIRQARFDERDFKLIIEDAS